MQWTDLCWTVFLVSLGFITGIASGFNTGWRRGFETQLERRGLLVIDGGRSREDEGP